ncbi:hypothetical protein V5O48_012949 [Marasmius crinis-equi]|uniref:Pentatricopeptide repeat-containing protein n=1 Tax=Marasmius crinis-equi TaxID=585013 RepID=A0ABR3F1E6_9AGAR
MFEKTISLLIHYRRFTEATTVYQRMKLEGYNASLITDAQMLAIGLASSTLEVEQAIDGFGRIFQAKGTNEGSGEARSFSDDDFVRLLGVLKDLDFPPQTIIHVIRKYISCRGESYVPPQVIVNILVGMLVREGKVDEAFRVIAHYDMESDQIEITSEDTGITVEADSGSDSNRSRPYATLISSLPPFDPLSQGAIDRVLFTIRSNEIQIDAAIFSALISHYARKCDVRRGISLYEALKKARVETGIGELRPDASVYKSVWWLGACSWLNNRKSKRYKQPSSISRSSRNRLSSHPSRAAQANLPPPVVLRPIFTDMIQYLFIDQSDSDSADPNIAQSLLNTSLQAFLAAEDYAAAIVLIKTLVEDLGVQVSGRTYACLIHGLRRNFQDDPAAIHRLLTRRPTKDGEPLRGKDLHDRWISLLLKLSRQKLEHELPSSVARLPAASPGTHASRRVRWHGRNRAVREAIPTIGIVNGTRPVPLGVQLSAKPLVRLLIRAIIARKMGYDPNLRRLKVPVSFPDKAWTRVDDRVAKTRSEMIPPGLEEALDNLKKRKR